MITIGRDPKSDIRVKERYDTVSNSHADIEEINGVLTFVDHSSNGTVVNGQKIHNRGVGIYNGDKILLAGVWELPWEEIERYFPQQRRPTVTRNIHAEADADDVNTAGNQWGRRTMPLDSGRTLGSDGSPRGRETEHFVRGRERETFTPGYADLNRQPDSQRQEPSARNYSRSEISKYIDKWNWGAFFCSWLWGVCNRIYWPLLIILVAWIPYIGFFCAVYLSVYLGMRGSKMAWEKSKSKDFESFRKTQSVWMWIGIVFFLLQLASIWYVFVNIANWID